MITHPRTLQDETATPPAGAPGSAAAGAPAAASHPAAGKRRGGWHRFTRFFLDRLDRVPLSAKLVASTLVVLIIGTVGISASIRQLVSGYLLEKTDNQIISQSTLIFRNTDLLRSMDQRNNGLNTYFLQIRYAQDGKLTGQTETKLYPILDGNVVTMPQLPSNSALTDDMLGTPFTTGAQITTLANVMGGSSSGSDSGQDSDSGASSDSGQDSSGSQDDAGRSAGEGSSAGSAGMRASTVPTRKTIQTAGAPWRVAAFRWEDQDANGNKVFRGIVFIGLSLSDQIDTINTLTRYCATVGIAIVLLGGSLVALLIQRTLDPLKRIEKTAAKIAAGDLSQRVPWAPENTEVGSLAASLNTMLARIEKSFHEQEQTTAKMKRFVSDASHELRTPLAAIHGYAELYTMQRGMPGALERADESIAHIEKSSQRMTVLVEDLLSLARLDEGRGIDMTQTVSLTTLVADALDDLHALDPEREVTRGTVAFRPSTDMDHPAAIDIAAGPMTPVTLTGDASRLRQVVTNIVGNIHRYTPSDSPARVGLGVMPASIAPERLAQMPSTDESMRHFLEAADVGQSMSTGTNYAVIRFEDHGPGVPDESRPQLFERFYTADPSRAREKGGTGLGLAIAQSVVKAHRGLICATGTPGGGLTFTIVLPLGPVAAPAVPSASAADRPADTDKTGKAKGKDKAGRTKRGGWFSR
ncbi:HAMP domain-containing histidine kinase [Bifidobacterium sp. CP2]|uniref:sensor histidine kinase n=1 Tax=Bifidobacterium sp. CP2 TaxID=2809025 RepID=UPI001BDCFBA4|nr:HAMP domain-containing sensor histidine kinase [Bifidobacterium sp. CP2]MBT1180443.1 HAMP domain-containing histidine kinase [Bifidobacterium sp. CP2]